MRLLGFDASRATWGVALAALAAASYVWLMPRAQGLGGLWVLNSPDAASVQVAAHAFAATGSLTWEPAGDWPAADSAPRSFTRVAGGWAPGSYVGLPAAYGALAKSFGIRALIWLTPLLGGLGVWLMYVLARRWRGARVALVAAGLLAVLPAYWHASLQPFTPTIPMAVALLAAAVGLTGRGAQSLAFGGFTLGLALAIRPHEALWILPVAALALVGRVSWKRIALVAACAAVPLAAVAWLQLLTYGGVLGTGYSPVSAGGGGPFSFNLRSIATNSWRYAIGLHGYLLGLAAAGAALAIRGAAIGRRYAWAIVVSFLGWLAIYGSYLVHDSPGLAEPTIGNSQVRYMLPLLILSVPLAAGVAARVRLGVAAAGVAIAATLGYGTVVAAPGDGALAVQRTLEVNASIQRLVLMVSSPDTLVVAGRLDKLFVGFRPTAYQATDELPELLKSGRSAVAVGGQGLPIGVRIGRRADLPGATVVQELLAE